MIVDDSAHHHGADFHLRHIAEIFGVQHGIFPAVFRKYPPVFEGDRLYGVQSAFDKDVFPFASPVDIKIAVIVLYGQAEHEAPAAPIFFRKLHVPQKRFRGIGKALDFKFSPFFHGKNGELSVAGGNKRFGREIKGTKLGADTAGKKGVKRGILLRQVLVHVYPVFLDVALDKPLGEPSVEVSPHRPGNETGGEQF